MPVSNQRTIKYFFNQVYNRGSLIDLIVPFERIKRLDDLYKTKRESFSTFEEFESAFPAEFGDCKKSKSAYKEIRKQFDNRMGLQACILTECFVAQTLANHLNLDQYIDLDDTTSTIPAQLAGSIYSAQGYNDGSKFRYCYYNGHYDALVFQCGASGTVDIVFTKYKLSIRIEIKEQLSKLEECDITGLYNEKGHLLLSDDFKVKRSKYVPYIHLFNAMTNVFDMEGHNFGFSSFLKEEKAKDIISGALDMRVVDVFILVIGDKLVPVLSDYLLDFVTLEGSEIRTAGRNYTRVFTPDFAKRKIESLGGVIKTDGTVELPYNPDNRVKGRGLDSFRRYSLGSLLFVKLDDALITKSTITFPFELIRQKKPSISIHLNARVNKPSLVLQFMKINEIVEA